MSSFEFSGFSKHFGLLPGDRVAIVGTGGKTALMDQLADENAAKGVLIAPTTRIGTDQIKQRTGVSYLGRMEGDKFAAAPLDEIEAAAQNYSLTLMEADGSKGLPLKGWAVHEPIVPAFATVTIGVIPVQALGLTANDNTVHRLPLFREQTGLSAGDAVTGAALSRMILWCVERYSMGRRVIFINQVDSEEQLAAARQIVRELRNFDGLVLMGSAREGILWNES